MALAIRSSVLAFAPAGAMKLATALTRKSANNDTPSHKPIETRTELAALRNATEQSVANASQKPTYTIDSASHAARRTASSSDGVIPSRTTLSPATSKVASAAATA